MRSSRSNGFGVSNPNHHHHHQQQHHHHHRVLPSHPVPAHGAAGPVRNNNLRLTYIDEVAILDVSAYSEVTVHQNPLGNIHSSHHGSRFQTVQHQDGNPHLRFRSSASTSDFSRPSETLNRIQQVSLVPDSFVAYQRTLQQNYGQVDESRLQSRVSRISALRNTLLQLRNMEGLDVDRMPYEELVDLGERIGNITTGLSKEAIQSHLKTRVHNCINEDADTCIVCQEEYENQERIGTLSCGHEYHVDCITKWLLLKNFCPICKRQSVAVM